MAESHLVKTAIGRSFGCPICCICIFTAVAVWSNDRLLPQIGSHTGVLASQGQIYAPKAYI